MGAAEGEEGRKPFEPSPSGRCHRQREGAAAVELARVRRGAPPAGWVPSALLQGDDASERGLFLAHTLKFIPSKLFLLNGLWMSKIVKLQ